MTEATLDQRIPPARAARDAAPTDAAAQPNRLDAAGVVDRSRRWGFSWDGRRLVGHPGDTLASALLAAGVKVVGRGFKYHRPRGVMSAGVEEGGAIVTVGEGPRRTPNTNAATEELFDGLVATGQNAWPSVAWDVGRVNDGLGAFLKAGFYYKTFFSFAPTTPRGTGHWMIFEKFIRKAAGMGRASRAPDPDDYETAHLFCDMLVVGSGPAGLEAARVAAEAGLDVVLAEQDFALGGRALSEAAPIEGRPPKIWVEEKLRTLSRLGVRSMPRTTAFGLYDGGVVGLVERVPTMATAPAPGRVRERLWILRTEKTVLATGAIERGLAFGDNDKPGVMNLSAVQTYVNRFGVAPGRRVVVASTHAGGLAAAAELASAGLETTLLDARGRAGDVVGGIAQYMSGAAPLRALGGSSVSGVEIAIDTAKGWRPGDRQDCDVIAVSGGWSPVVNLLSHRGVKPVWSEELACFLPGRSAEPIEACGAAAGVWEVDACAASGRNAVARLLGRAEEPLPEAPAAIPMRPLYEVRAPGRKTKSFVDPQHDVTAADIQLAHREGYVSVEHMKRYTTLGMAVDQGKNGNVVGLALMADALGRDVPEVGTTTFRPPYTPVSIGALAGRARGRHFKPERRTPMHAWNMSRGAEMTDAGLWRRPWYYPKAGEGVDAAYIREAAAVRETVGLCDVTSLGKIAVQGPDAAEFLNRIYTNGFAKLPIGKARYGIMLRDDGVVFDDGTTWRLSETDFFMTTTTAGAGKVMSWLEELLQIRWPELRVAVASVSEQWAGFAVAGPHARNVMKAVVDEVDFSEAAFPFMGVRDGRLGVAGDRPGDPVACRIARLSFSGELAYEIYVESDYGEALAEALWRAAEPIGGVLYGTEALGALRIEKGHVAGAELDGRTTLDDLGLGGMGSQKKAYVGQALAKRPAMRAENRQTLVGLVPVDRSAVFKAGAILCASDAVSGHGVGWVASVTHSPALGHWIGLGLIEGGVDAWKGRGVVAADPVRGMETAVEVTSPHFFDPTGARMRPDQDPAAPAALVARDPSAPCARRSALGALWSRDGDQTAQRRVIGRAASDDPEDPTTRPGDAAAWIVETAPRSRWQAVAWPGAQARVEAALADIVGAPPPRPGRVSIGSNGVELARVGPLTWRARGLDAAAVATLNRIAPEDGAVLSIDHADARFLLGGPRAADLANRFLPIDLRDRSFPIGGVAQTAMHHTAVELQRVGADVYALCVPRSYARSLWALLEETLTQWRG